MNKIEGLRVHPITPNRSYEIHEVAELTGLQAARLRVWERRYAVVRPRRQSNSYRAYTSEQVALLRAFARLCAAGERIGDLVKLPRAEVIARAEGHAVDNSPISGMVDAVRRLDRDRLRALLTVARRERTVEEFGREIVLPFAEVLGDLWVLGQVNVAAEHLASELVVQELKAELVGAAAGGPVLLAACLEGERHEWGFLIALIRLQALGWRVQYLGAELPLKDLIDAAWTIAPQVVALSAADPANVVARIPELRGLSRLLPPGVVVVLGGAGAEANRARLHRARVRVGEAEVPVLPAEALRPASVRIA